MNERRVPTTEKQVRGEKQGGERRRRRGAGLGTQMGMIYAMLDTMGVECNI